MEILSIVVSVAASKLPIIGRKIVSRSRHRRIAADAASVLVANSAERFIEHLGQAELQRLEQFVNSPQFGHLMLQTLLDSSSRHKDHENGILRAQLRASLRHGQVFGGADLYQATDVLLELLYSSAHAVRVTAKS